MAVSNQLTRFVLRSLDTGIEWESQYQPIGVRHNRQSNWMDASSVNRNHPFTMWVSGRTETIQFQLRLFSHSLGVIYKDAGMVKHKGPFRGPVAERVPIGGELLRDKIADLERMYYKDTNVGRPHILQFTWGRINLKVTIIDLTTVYGELDSVGVHRDVTISLVLKRFEEVPQVDSVSRIQKVNESRFYSAKNHESYESIAAKSHFYGSPKYGEFLRRRHPELNDLSVNDRVHIPPRSSIVGFRLTPQSPPFDRSNASAVDALRANRNNAALRVHVSTVVTTDL